MTMNKKELQMVEDLKVQLALKFTTKVNSDIPIPDIFSNTVNGYSYNEFSIKVFNSCSNSYSHGWQHDKTDCQQGISQFSKKSLAAKAMRNELELKYAKELRRVDLMIEQFEKEEAEQKI